MTECFWCKKEIKNGITLDKKELCSAECVKQYKDKAGKLSNKSNTCEFC